jgi:hypothetical protein
MKGARPPKSGAIELIPPEAYPQVLPPAAAKAFARRLMSEETVSRASRMVAAQGRDLRQAILADIERLQKLAPEDPQVYAEAHEIRGLAETAGLAAAGRICERLCRYVETAARASKAADPVVVRLHVDAIARSANAADEAELLGDAVVRELDALVASRPAAAPQR